MTFKTTISTTKVINDDDNNINNTDLYNTAKESIKKMNENAITKQEIAKLIDVFDQKFNELHDIKSQIIKLLNDVN